MDTHAIFFSLCTFGLFVLPLVPALREYADKSDAEPLRVVQEYDNDPHYFAKGFRQYVRLHFPSFFGAPPTPQALNLNDRNAYHLVTEDTKPVFTSQETSQGRHYRLVLAHAPLALPDNFMFEREIYCTRDLTSGRWNQFRALLAEEDIMLNKYSTVFRWVQSGGTLHVNEGCVLYGRATADKSIVLLRGVRFERLHAPLIRFGMETPTSPTPPVPEKLAIISRPTNLSHQFENNFWVKGNLDIPRHSSFTGNLIASGNVTIGAGSRIEGSIKSQGNIRLGSGATVSGSLFSGENISIGEHCTVGGPVMATLSILLGSGTVVGAPEAPTTVNARNVAVMDNVTAYGTVWATEYGVVEEKQGA